MIIGLLAYRIDRILFWFQRGLFPYRAVQMTVTEPAASPGSPANVVEFHHVTKRFGDLTIVAT